MGPRMRTLSVEYAEAYLYKREGKPRPKLRVQREAPTWKGQLPLGRPFHAATSEDRDAIAAYLRRVG